MPQPHETQPPLPRTDIDRFLRRIRRRLFGARALRNLSIDSLLGGSALCLLVLLDRLLWPGIAQWRVLGGVAGGVAALSLLRTLLWHRVPAGQAAIVADARLALRERVSSSLALRESGAVQDELRELIEADARQAIAQAPVERSFPVRVPRLALWNLVPVAVGLCLLLWVPALDLLGVAGRKEASARDKKEVAEKQKDLNDKLAELARKAEDRDLADAKKLLEMLAQQPPPPEPRAPSEPQAADKTQGDPRKEALVEMTRREDAIKKGLEGEKFEPLKDAQKALKGLELKSLTLTKKLQEALKDGDLKKAQKELDKLKDEMGKLADKQKSSELTPEEKERLQKLADELQKLAKDSRSLAKLSQALSKASAQLSQSQLSESLESLEQSAQELASLAEMADELEMLNQALELVELSKEELAKLTSCPMCGTPYCPDCGKPQCECKPDTKPGGT